MAEPYIGEIRMFGGNFAPVGWALCNGAMMSIADNDILYSLIGTMYGGDGQTTFQLPNLCGRVPIHRSNMYPMGQAAGVETVTLLQNQIPAHTHTVAAQSQNGTLTSPVNAVFAASSLTQYTTDVNGGGAGMYVGAVSVSGGSVPHDNMMPFQVLNFIIALEGIYPQQN